MSKRILAAFMAAFMLAGCQKAPTPSASSSEPSATVAGVAQLDTNPVLSNVEFDLKKMDEYMYLMALQPAAGSGVTQEMAVCVPEDYDMEEIEPSEFSVNYKFYQYYTNQIYGTARVQTAPADLKAYFKTEDEAKIKDEMAPEFFTVESMYEGTKQGAVNDFGYELKVDWTGTVYGLPAYYIEFIDAESGNHALRFYVSNDEINERFYACEIKMNVPVDDAELLKLCREVIFSFQPL